MIDSTGTAIPPGIAPINGLWLQAVSPNIEPNKAAVNISLLFTLNIYTPSI